MNAASIMVAAVTTASTLLVPTSAVAITDSFFMKMVETVFEASATTKYQRQTVTSAVGTIQRSIQLTKTAFGTSLRALGIR